MNTDQKRDQENWQLVAVLLCSFVFLTACATARNEAKVPKEWPKINQGMRWGPIVTNDAICGGFQTK